MPEANGEISNEFFKKLNQQIVQKDNLIKLLQLQIRNLKNQIESGEADNDRADDLQTALEQKNSELESLRVELDEQKKLCKKIGDEKDSQIRSLNEMLENNKNMSVAEYVEDPKIVELEDNLRKIQSDYHNVKKELDELKIEKSGVSDENSQLKSEIEKIKGESDNSLKKISELNGLLDKKQAELQATTDELKATVEELKSKTEQLEAVPNELNALKDEEIKKAVLEANNKNQEQIEKISLEAETYKTQVAELSQQMEDMQKNLEAKEKNQISVDDELKKANDELNEAKNEILRLTAENEKINDKVNVYETEKQDINELKNKLITSEETVDKLNKELEKLNSEGVSKTKHEEYMLQISQLRQTVEDKEEEISKLQRSLELKRDEVPSVDNKALESLSQQYADQLLITQNVEKQLREAKNQLVEKEAEINMVKNQLEEQKSVKVLDAPVTLDNDETLASFIDFFDGLDAALSKKSDPELQNLHKKLMDRLIIPNKINYMPVISEEFDVNKHIATTYFRSDKFPERCIVFEVEKGYTKGDKVIKKSKVWVVQNLYRCTNCGVAQTNPESRFCHLCGTRIVAPNGLSIDNLPIFEPTATTYSNFSQRMMEKGDLTKAKEYIEFGLNIDPNYLPLIFSMSDVLITESRFQEAIDYLERAYKIKPDERTRLKIQEIETKLNIFSNARSLNLSSEEFDKLIHLIQK